MGSKKIWMLRCNSSWTFPPFLFSASVCRTWQKSYWNVIKALMLFLPVAICCGFLPIAKALLRNAYTHASRLEDYNTAREIPRLQ